MNGVKYCNWSHFTLAFKTDWVQATNKITEVEGPITINYYAVETGSNVSRKETPATTTNQGQGYLLLWEMNAFLKWLNSQAQAHVHCQQKSFLPMQHRIDTSIKPTLRTDAVDTFLMNCTMIRLNDLWTFENNCWKIYFLVSNCNSGWKMDLFKYS